MRKTFLSTVSLWILSVMTTTAQVKLQPTQIDQVLKAMTLEEKAALVVGGNRRISVEENNGMVGSHSHQVPGAAGMTQAIQRLGIPATVLTDGPAGVRISPTRKNDSQTYYCTGFPVGTAGGSGEEYRQRSAGVRMRRASCSRHEHPSFPFVRT